MLINKDKRTLNIKSLIKNAKTPKLDRNDRFTTDRLTFDKYEQTMHLSALVPIFIQVSLHFTTTNNLYNIHPCHRATCV